MGLIPSWAANLSWGQVGGDRERRHPAACPGEPGGPGNQFADLGATAEIKGSLSTQFPGGPGWSQAWGASGPGESRRRSSLSRCRAFKRLQKLIPGAGDVAGSQGTQRGCSQTGAHRSTSAVLGTGHSLGGRSRLTQRRSERASPARSGLPGPRARVAAHSSC